MLMSRLYFVKVCLCMNGVRAKTTCKPEKKLEKKIKEDYNVNMQSL